ncbi:hypothetical protein KXW36_000748, partial [Aspergillus fumigatus]
MARDGAARAKPEGIARGQHHHCPPAMLHQASHPVGKRHWPFHGRARKSGQQGHMARRADHQFRLCQRLASGKREAIGPVLAQADDRQPCSRNRISHAPYPHFGRHHRGQRAGGLAGAARHGGHAQLCRAHPASACAAGAGAGRRFWRGGGSGGLSARCGDHPS